MGSHVDEVRCRVCKMPYKAHGVDTKCLFEASSFDGTEELRIALGKDINAAELEREDLEKKYGSVWDTKQVQEVFKIHGFLAPLVRVTRLADNVRGAMLFQHSPRYYFAFQPFEG